MTNQCGKGREKEVGGRTLSVLVAQRLLSHVGQLDRSLRARVAEKVAGDGVEFGGGDDLGELLHVDGLDIEDVCGRKTS
jgi:hypothetical protein